MEMGQRSHWLDLKFFFCLLSHEARGNCNPVKCKEHNIEAAQMAQLNEKVRLLHLMSVSFYCI